MSDKVSDKERNFLMNEEIVNQMAEAIEESVSEIVGSILSQDSLESEIGSQIESLINDNAGTWASDIASEVIRNVDYTTLFENINFAEIVRQAVANNTNENVATTFTFAYQQGTGQFPLMQYTGKVPENVSQLIDSIIYLTEDGATVMQFFQRIALLREFALTIKNGK
jgi:hypothetical protein